MSEARRVKHHGGRRQSKPAAASIEMRVTADEARAILRLRQLANSACAEARVALPDLSVEMIDSRAIIGLHGNV